MSGELTRERQQALAPYDEAQRALGLSGWEVWQETRLTSSGDVSALYVARYTLDPDGRVAWHERAASLPELVRRCWTREDKYGGR